MYGILLEGVIDGIKEEYGPQLWENIAEVLNLDADQIMTNSCYSDAVFFQIIDAIIMLRQEGDYDFYMEFFGRKFVTFFSSYGFEKILRVAGRHFRDFLHSIDQLHDSNRYTFPHMKSPLFFVESEDSSGVLLHYQTRRRGFNSYVIGQLKECAQMFYKIPILVYIAQDLSNDEFNHVVFRIDFDNRSYLVKSLKKESQHEALSATYEKIKPHSFLNLFPFSFGFDETLKMRYCGTAIQDLFKVDISDMKVYEAFNLVRPAVKMDWNLVLVHSSSIIFEFENILPLKYGENEATKLFLKGQMKYIKELKQVLFLGHPVLKNMREMHEVGLYLNELNKFDGSAEMLVTELQHHDNLEKALEAQQAFSGKLESAKVELSTWRRKGKKLLYSMLPAKIARQIENGIQPNTICETYDEVTIMFANTADFSSIIKDAEPKAIIDFINSTVSMYDRVVSTYDKVNKIETKADGSYMVVSGLESQKDRKVSVGAMSQGQTSMFSSRTTATEDEEMLNKRQFPEYNQVELLCSVALEILENSKEFKNPFNTDSLKIKIGIHTGTIVAGIVGLSKIQFCLFGDTVNTSSRMCSNSVAGRTTLSESSYKFLKDSPNFCVEFRDRIEMKGKGSMDTYWLIGQKNK